MASSRVIKAKFRRLVSIVAIALVVGVGLPATAAFFAPQAAAAASGADFDPGMIITDELFYDANAMTQAEIQTFLEAKEPGVCGPNSCLKNYRMTTPDRAQYFSTSSGRVECQAYQGAVNELASTIIFRVQQACEISAKVILVTLQKERGLVTKTSPTSADFTVAMGYGCPDSAACDTHYYGLFNQIRAAAEQFKRYRIAPGDFGYRAGRINHIQYKPYTTCGTVPVLIRNQATAGLYNYTPYVPNAAALSNMYGLGDSCSSYGNRNFFAYYSDWFGSPSSPGARDIEQAYARWGGAGGVLGAAIGTPNSISGNGGGLVQAYENAAIAWTERFGAYVVMGDVRAYLGAEGGIDGPIGWPMSDPNSLSVHGGGVVQAFMGGAVTVSALGGSQMVSGDMRGFLNSLGGLAGDLGWPSGKLECVGQSHCTQSFVGGVAYLMSSGPSYYLAPAIHESYAAEGGPLGALGRPASNPIVFTANGGGVVQAFEKAAIAGASGGIAYPMTGGLRTAYGMAGGTVGALGWPVSTGVCASGECSQSFQYGTAYWSQNHGYAHSVGVIATAYAAAGGPQGTLGWPVTGILEFGANGGGQVQGYTAGAMATSSSGAFALRGNVRNHYNVLGGTNGALGWPVAEAQCTATECSQAFQKGTVLWSDARGGAHSLGPISLKYSELGGPTGPVGWPATGMIPFAANGGGTVQGFDSAALATSSAGTYALSGGVRGFYNLMGGTTGSLGWPSGEMSCVGDVCTQDFQNGTVEYSAATGGRVL